MLDYPDMSLTELEQAVAVMRRLGVRRWGDIELDNEPPQQTAAEETQHPTDPDKVEAEARRNRQSLALSAAGKLVRRLGQNT